MLQSEYESQSEIQRLPVGSVIIEKFHTWAHNYILGGESVEVRTYQVETCGDVFQYRTNPKYDNGTLYTMDEHGNCKAPSVFREPQTNRS